MEATMSVAVEHLGGPATVSVSMRVEPNAEAFNAASYETMAVTLNLMLHAMLRERDRLRFEDERTALHIGEQPARPEDEGSSRDVRDSYLSRENLEPPLRGHGRPAQTVFHAPDDAPDTGQRKTGFSAPTEHDAGGVATALA